MMATPDNTPTIPKLTNMAERSGLVAVLTILEAIQAKTLSPEACATWIRETLGLDVDKIGEKGVGFVALRGSWSPGRAERFAQVAGAARAEVVKTLRGLLARPQVDAFVSRALHKERVRRETIDGRGRWVARATDADSLSDLLLLVLVADILGYRESYDTRLSICDTCGRITFVERRSARFGCFEHPVR